MKIILSFTRFLALSMLTLAAHAALAVDYYVYGAPQADFNGVYVENGTRNGFPKFERRANGSTYVLYEEFTINSSRYYLAKNSVDFYANINIPVSLSTPPPIWKWRTANDFTVVRTLFVETATEKLRFDTTEFIEAEANDGSIGNSIVITHNNFNGTTFTGTNGDDFVQDGKVTVANVPAGLTAEVVRISSTEVRMRLLGSATASAHVDDINNLTLTFLNGAFSSDDASVIENITTSTIAVNFRDQYSVGVNGDFATIAAAVAGVNRYDILQLDAAVYTEKNITINKELLIRGQGADQTIIQAMATPKSETGRIFRINSGLASVAIRAVTLRNGHLSGGNPDGSAISSTSYFELSDCRVTNNSASSTALIYSAAVYASVRDDRIGKINVERCLFDNNIATRTNTGQVFGGGMFLDAYYAHTTIENSTFHGNKALSTGSSPDAVGGALYSRGHASLVIRNSTFADNEATGRGGAIYSDADFSVKVENSIIYGNNAVFDNSVEDIYMVASYGWLDIDHSIIGSRTTFPNDTVLNELSSNPLLQTLADNGGPTFTMALGNSSPALGAGTQTIFTPTVDQRNFARVGAIDIGAWQQPEPYSLSYDGNGADSGSVNTSTCPTGGVSCSISVAAGTALSRTNYSFVGWNTAAAGTGTSYQAGDSLTLSADTVLYAQWAINQYTITFASAGGSTVAPITQNFATAVTAPTPPTRSGYSFTGWSPAVPSTMPANNLTVTAQWQANAYTITFASAGGSTVAPITQNFATAVTAPTPPTRSGYTFTGWSPAVPSTMPANNLTVTAQWQINSYTVTFDVNGGTRSGGGQLQQTVAFGAAATAPEITAPAGWAFTGWQGNFQNVQQNETVTATYRFIPVGQALQLETLQEQTLTITPVVSGEAGATLNLIVVGQPQHGTLTALSNGWRYLPATGYSGVDSFTYRVSDGVLQSALYQVVINIIAVDVPPVANDDSYTLPQASDGIYLLGVIANDTHADDEPLTIIAASTEIGQVTVVNNQLRYEAPVNFVGVVQLRYVIRDTDGQTAQAQVILEISGTGDGLGPIITLPDAVSVDAQGRLTRVQLGTAAAVDQSGRSVPVTLMNDSPLFAPGRNVAYWKATDYDGRESYAGQSVEVRPLVSFAHDISAVPGTDVTITVYLNGDAPEYPLVVPFTVSDGGSGAAAAVVPRQLVIESGHSASFTFTAPQLSGGAASTETLVFSLDAALNRGANSQQQVIISNANSAPRVNLTVAQGQQTRAIVSQADGLVTVTASARDSNPTDVLSFTWQAPFAVTTSADGEQISFDAAALEAGIYAITVRTVDSATPSLAGDAVVYVTVVETLPTLGDSDSNGNLISDRVDGWGDSNRNGIANYLDPFSRCDVVPSRLTDGAFYVLLAQPDSCLAKGQAASNSSDGGVLLSGTPSDSAVRNVGGVVDVLLTQLPHSGQGYVVIPQRLPVPGQARYRLYNAQQQSWFDFVESATDKIWSAAGEPGVCPAPGSALWSAGLTAGHYCVQLQVSDGGANDLDTVINGMLALFGGVGAGAAIQETNPPTADNDSVTMRWNSQVDIDVLANDSATGDLTVVRATAALGTAEILADNRIRFTPPDDYAGIVAIVYAVSDGQGGIAAATSFVEILANTAPQAAADTASTNDRTPIVIAVLANDSDIDNDVLSVVSASAQRGTVVVVDGQTLRYTPQSGFAGTDTLTYQISDGRGGSATGTVQVTVTVAPPPAVTPPASSGSKGSVPAWLVLLVLGLVSLRGRHLTR